jgi:hypothetical protein
MPTHRWLLDSNVRSHKATKLFARLRSFFALCRTVVSAVTIASLSVTVSVVEKLLQRLLDVIQSAVRLSSRFADFAGVATLSTGYFVLPRFWAISR